MRLLTLRSVTPEGVINRNVWSATQNRQTWYGCKSACSVCGIATRGGIELLRYAGCNLQNWHRSHRDRHCNWQTFLAPRQVFLYFCCSLQLLAVLLLRICFYCVIILSHYRNKTNIYDLSIVLYSVASFGLFFYITSESNTPDV